MEKPWERRPLATSGHTGKPLLAVCIALIPCYDQPQGLVWVVGTLVAEIPPLVRSSKTNAAQVIYVPPLLSRFSFS
jgi:hypothetical protein